MSQRGPAIGEGKEKEAYLLSFRMELIVVQEGGRGEREEKKERRFAAPSDQGV